MPHIYSTLSCGNTYVNYVAQADTNINVPQGRGVSIKGGANVAQKRFINDDGTNTPAGVRTEVSDDELAYLKKNDEFMVHVKRGFIVITEGKEKLSAVVSDMTEGDKSAQFTAEDYKEGGRATTEGLQIDAPSVGDADESASTSADEESEENEE